MLYPEAGVKRPVLTQFKIQIGVSCRNLFSISKVVALCRIKDRVIIFKIEKPRNRIMLELMARAGMRIGEVLKIRPVDIQDRKITLPDPKSGRESEIVYIPQKIADRLREYIQDKGIEPEQRIFPIAYNAARVMFKKAGELAGVNLRPHDLRRHAATHARRLNLHWPLCKPA